MLLSVLRKIVESQFERPNMAFAGIFFILPFIVLIVFKLVLGIGIDFVQMVLGAGRELVYLTLSSVLAYLLLLGFKGKGTNGRFSSILSVLSVQYLITAVSFILAAILVWAVFPSLFSTVASLQGTGVTTEQLAFLISSMSLPSQQMLVGLFALLLIIGILSVGAWLYAIYKIASLTARTGPFSNSVFTIVFAFLSALLNLAVTFAFSLII